VVPALSVENLTVHYGERAALSEVSLRVDPGEFVALVGPNGSGKSTLLKAGLGLIPSARGGVCLFGEPVASLSIAERARRVAWVPQEEALRDEIVVARFVLYGRYPHLGPFASESEQDRSLARSALTT